MLDDVSRTIIKINNGNVKEIVPFVKKSHWSCIDLSMEIKFQIN